MYTRRVFLASTTAFAASPALAQLSLTGAGGAGAFVFDPAALAIFAAFTTPPTGARKTLINNCVVALKAAGVWTTLDTLWITAAADSQAATINWKSPATFTLAPQSAPTFTADRGFAGNGTTSFLKTGFIPASNGVAYQQDSASMGFWGLTAGLALGPIEFGSIDSGGRRSFMRCRNDATNGSFSINTGTSVVLANTVTNGFFIGVRSNNSTVNVYQNAVSLGSISAASVLPANAQSYIGALNNNGVTGSFATNQIAMATIGGSLTPTQVTAFYNATLAYMQGVGAQ